MRTALVWCVFLQLSSVFCGSIDAEELRLINLKADIEQQLTMLEAAKQKLAQERETVETLKSELLMQQKQLHEACSALKDGTEKPDSKQTHPSSEDLQYLKIELEKMQAVFEQEHENPSEQEDEEPKRISRPKEISIFCPSAPQVHVVDLMEEEEQCLVLNIRAPSLDSRLVLLCDEQAE